MSARKSISNSFCVTTVTDGIVYDIQVPVESVHIGDGQTSATLSGTAKFYQKEGDNDKVQTAFYYGIYKRTGTTYTKVATGNANSYTFSSLSIANTVEAVSIYLFKSSYTSTSPESQAYIAKREIVVVNDGSSAIYTQITNEMDSVACDKDGVTNTGSDQSVFTAVAIWKGTTKLTLSDISVSVDGTTIGSSYSGSSGSITYCYKATVSEADGTVTVYVRNGTTIASKVEVGISMSSSSLTQARAVTMTINGVRAGSNGQPAVIYSLVPSVNEIVKKKNGTYVPSGSSYVTCAVTKNSGGTQSTPASSEYSLKYSLDGGSTESDYPSGGVLVSNVTSTLTFILRVPQTSGTVVDRETIGLITDGDDGEGAVYALISNEMTTIIGNASGTTLEEQSVTTYVSLWQGDDQLELSGISVSIDGTTIGTDYSSDDTSIAYYYKASVNTSTGAVTVTVNAGAAIPTQTDISISMSSSSVSSSRVVTFTIKADRIAYELLPSTDMVRAGRTADGGYVTDQGTIYTSVKCGYTRTSQGVVTSVADTTANIDGTYRVFFRRRIRAGATVSSTTYTVATWETSFYNYYTASYKRRIVISSSYPTSGLDVSTYDAVQFIIYEQTSSNTVSNSTVTSNPNKLADRQTVQVLYDGESGTKGINSAAVFIYKKADETPNDRPTIDLYYQFSDGKLYTDSGCTDEFTSSTTGSNGWSPTIPDDSASACFVRQAAALGTGSYDQIEYTEWSGVRKLASDGGNSAVVTLYKRSASTISSVGISITLYYNFDNGKLYTNASLTTEFTDTTSGGNGWSPSIPTGTNPIYITTAVAYSSKTYDYIQSAEWVTPAKFVQNGDNGVAYSIKVNRGMLAIASNAASISVPAGNLVFTSFKNSGGSTSAYTCYFKLFKLEGSNYGDIGNYNYMSGDPASSFSNTAITVTSSVNALVCCIYDSETDSSTTHDGYLAEIVVPVVKYGDTGPIGEMGRMYYPAGEWNKDTTYTRTDTICPVVLYDGDYYYPTVTTPDSGSQNDNPYNNDAEWALIDQFGIVFAEALFSNFGKLGSSVFNGDYQFSQYGYLYGFQGETRVVNNQTAYLNADPADMFGNMSSMYDNIPNSNKYTGSEINYTEWDEITFATGIKVTSGKWYTFEITASQYDGASLDWWLKQGNATIGSGAITSKSFSSQTLIFQASSSTDLTLEIEPFGGPNDNPGEDSFATFKSFYLRECRFIPKSTINWLSGSSVWEDVYIRGNISQSVLEITPSNYTRYCCTPYGGNATTGYSNGPLFLDLTKLGTLVRITRTGDNGATWPGNARPPIYAPDFLVADESLKDRIRGLAGRTITIINASGSSVTIKSRGKLRSYYKTGASESSRTISSSYKNNVLVSNVCMLECLYGLDETWNAAGTTVTYGEESVRWRIRVQGGSETSLSTSTKYQHWDYAEQATTVEMKSWEAAEAQEHPDMQMTPAP